MQIHQVFLRPHCEKPPLDLWWSGPLSMCFRASTRNFTRTSSTAIWWYNWKQFYGESRTTLKLTKPPPLHAMAQKNGWDVAAARWWIWYLHISKKQTVFDALEGRFSPSQCHPSKRLWPGGRMRSGRGNWWALTRLSLATVVLWVGKWDSKLVLEPPPKNN